MIELERLTERWSESTVKLKGCSNVYANVERKRAHIQNAIVRLAAYEDSGLMPDEIAVFANIVKCNDCRYSSDGLHEMCVYCTKHDCNMHVNAFCGYGKKVEE